MEDKLKALTGKAVLIGATLLEDELAEALGVRPSFVKKLRYDGLIPFVQVGHGKVIYLADSIMAWLRRREKQKTPVDSTDSD